MTVSRLMSSDQGQLKARFEQVQPALCQYLDLLVAWNQRVDLTAARSEDELVDLVLADALVLAGSHFVSQPAGAASGPRLVDVGSGAGAPAIPVALLHPGLALTLVEPKAKRVAFLRTCLGALSLPGVVARRGRSELLAAGSFEIAMSRATLPPSDWLREGARLATRTVWVLLARGDAPRLAGWRLVDEQRYQWPLTGVERRALRYQIEEHAR